MLIVDAHEDIAYNALLGGRDLRMSVSDKRRVDPGDNRPGRVGSATVGLPDLLKGGVAVVFGTLYASKATQAPGEEARAGYTTPKEAEAVAVLVID